TFQSLFYSYLCPMRVSLQNIGKKFGREWIFRGVDHVFEAGKPTVILGANGSGKSTLLQVIAGSLIPGEGKTEYVSEGTTVPQEEIYRHVSIASPYLDLVDDFTLHESISFHRQFKNFRNGMKEKDLLEISGLTASKDKQLKNFSSGMKMRVRLLLAILSDTSLLLLDEPCSNLDRQGCEWYAQLVTGNLADRCVIVCSNQVKEEHFFCTEEIRMEAFHQ
ncbi:MAG TPA: ATP-binding cassette domain-containing protein, partial [Bacteroidia bacterium]|nr:ATP-binding cassette domain-containing protein [Bacteroidia bacterium]